MQIHHPLIHVGDPESNSQIDKFDLFFPVYNSEIVNSNLKKSAELNWNGVYITKWGYRTSSL